MAPTTMEIIGYLFVAIIVMGLSIKLFKAIAEHDYM